MSRDALDALVVETGARLAAQVWHELRPLIRDEIRSALAERESYLTNREAAAYTGRSLAAWGVYVRRHRDLLKMAIGSSRSRRWRRSDLEAWFEREGERAT
jgi:hypothetical protein